MNWKPKLTSRPEEPADIEALDPALKQALGDFKASVRGWSDAAYNRQHTAQSIVVSRSWRLAAGWSLAAVLLAGTVSGGFYEHQQAGGCRADCSRCKKRSRSGRLPRSAPAMRPRRKMTSWPASTQMFRVRCQARWSRWLNWTMKANPDNRKDQQRTWGKGKQ